MKLLMQCYFFCLYDIPYMFKHALKVKRAPKLSRKFARPFTTQRRFMHRSLPNPAKENEKCSERHAVMHS